MIGRNTTGCAGAVMSNQIRRGSDTSDPGGLEERAGSSSKTTPPISTSSPGSNPRASSAAITPEPAQPLLDVGERLLVLEVVARDQPVDRRAGDAEPAVADALDLEAAPGRRAEDAELGHLVLAARPPPAPAGGRHAAQQLARELLEARRASRSR